MNEIWSSITKAIDRRVSNSLIGTFATFWLIFHWNFFVTLFFVSEEYIYIQFFQLKNEYLLSLLYNYKNWHFWVDTCGPVLLTWLLIWIFPKYLLIPALKKEEEYWVNKKKIRLESEAQIEEAKKIATKEETQSIKETVKKTQELDRLKKINPTIGWFEDYKYFSETSFSTIFKYIVESIYQHNGDIKWFDQYEQIIIPQDLLAYAHTNDLVVLDKKAGKIELTDKGKFFVKEYTANMDRVRRLIK